MENKNFSIKEKWYIDYRNKTGVKNTLGPFYSEDEVKKFIEDQYNNLSLDKNYTTLDVYKNFSKSSKYFSLGDLISKAIALINSKGKMLINSEYTTQARNIITNARNNLKDKLSKFEKQQKARVDEKKDDLSAVSFSKYNNFSDIVRLITDLGIPRKILRDSRVKEVINKIAERGKELVDNANKKVSDMTKDFERRKASIKNRADMQIAALNNQISKKKSKSFSIDDKIVEEFISFSKELLVKQGLLNE